MSDTPSQTPVQTQNPPQPAQTNQQISQAQAGQPSSSVPPTQAPSQPSSPEQPPPPSSPQTQSQPEPSAAQAQQQPNPDQSATQNETPPTTPSTESVVAIKVKTKRLSIISIIIIVFLLAATAGINYFTKNKLATLELNKQQILSTQANNQYLEQASGFVANRQDQLEYILSALPTDSSLVDFIRSVELIAQEHSASSTIDFNARTPSGSNGEKYIPVNIRLSTDAQNFIEFLTKIEKLQYILQVTGIEAARIPGSDNIWQYTIQARVYVRDDFYQQE